MKETNGGAYQSDWTEKGGCHCQSEVAQWCLRTVEKQEVNPATCVNTDKTGFKKLDLFPSFCIILVQCRYSNLKNNIGQFFFSNNL